MDYRVVTYSETGTLRSGRLTRQGLADCERAILPYVDCHDGRPYLFTGYAVETYVPGIGWVVGGPEGDSEEMTVGEHGVW